MFERFSDRARKVLSFARQEAERFNHNYIGTEHILLGLLKEYYGIAAMFFEKLNIDPEKIKTEIERLVKPAPGVSTVGQMPFTPQAKACLDFAIDESRAMDLHYVGTEHILLGLIRTKDGFAAQVLGKAIEMDIDKLRGVLSGNIAEAMPFVRLTDRELSLINLAKQTLRNDVCAIILHDYGISLDSIWDKPNPKMGETH